MVNKFLGKNIKYYRKYNGFTQKQFAKLMKVSDKAISAWEVGRSQPTATQLYRIGIILDTDINNFFMRIL